MDNVLARLRRTSVALQAVVEVCRPRMQVFPRTCMQVCRPCMEASPCMEVCMETYFAPCMEASLEACEVWEAHLPTRHMSPPPHTHMTPPLHPTIVVTSEHAAHKCAIE